MRAGAVAALWLACLGASGQPVAERSALLERAESALARGDVTAAAETFDRAAMMQHAPDTEMGLVRAYMQGGEYRRALAFGAHAAAAHLESPGAASLYAWLLRVGGQPAHAERVLGETLARAPADPIALDVGRAFAMPWPLAAGLLLETPHRMAPQATMAPGQASVPGGAKVVASGVAIDGGQRALVPTSALGSALPRRLWVRNGLGQTREARMIDAAAPAFERFGLTVLLLSASLETQGADVLAPRDPFAGSPGFVVEYARSDAAAAAWPWLRQGFFGSVSNDGGGLRRLGIDVPDGPHGGPVFDASGRLAGIALPGPNQRPAMLPVSLWVGVAKADGGQLPATPPRAGRAAGIGGVMPIDEAYERALRVALQVITAP